MWRTCRSSCLICDDHKQRLPGRLLQPGMMTVLRLLGGYSAGFAALNTKPTRYSAFFNKTTSQFAHVNQSCAADFDQYIIGIRVFSHTRDHRCKGLKIPKNLIATPGMNP